jgi:uncharacterized cupin superfamily protein
VQNGHHFINETGAEARFLVIGTRSPQEFCFYSDIDMKVEARDGSYNYTHKDGTALKGEDE